MSGICDTMMVYNYMIEPGFDFNLENNIEFVSYVNLIGSLFSISQVRSTGSVYHTMRELICT